MRHLCRSFTPLSVYVLLLLPSLLSLTDFLPPPQVGAFVSPLLIGGFVDRGVSWQNYYFIPLFLSLVLAVVAFFVFRGCMFFRPVRLSRCGSERLRLADVPPPDEAHEDHAVEAAGDVVHARAVMSASERMKRALKIRAVWVGFGLIAIAFV